MNFGLCKVQVIDVSIKQRLLQGLARHTMDTTEDGNRELRRVYILRMRAVASMNDHLN